MLSKHLHSTPQQTCANKEKDNALRKTKTEYFQKLNVKDLSDNRKFWKTVKPFFSNKGLNSNKLMLKENNRLITEEKELATVMNTFFVNITESLDL